MNFAEALASSHQRPGTACAVTFLLASLDDEDRAALQGALDNPEVQGSTIARALQSMGHKVAGNTVSRHRRGDCRCD